METRVAALLRRAEPGGIKAAPRSSEVVVNLARKCHARVLARGLRTGHDMDGREKRIVREVIHALQTPSGEEIAAVSFSDGTCGITRDGTILDSIQWAGSEREHCLAFLERFARTT